MDEEISVDSLQVPISLPCSVITPNLAVHQRNGLCFSALETSVSNETHFSVNSNELPVNTSASSRPVPASHIMVSVHDMPQEPSNKCDQPLPQRTRKVKRPYSPELIIIRDKKQRHKNVAPTSQELLQNKVVCSDIGFKMEKPFSCQKCKSPFVVDPSRSRLPLSKAKRKPVARKIVDDVSKEVLVVCNACGLATGRKPARPVLIPPTVDEKSNFLKGAIAFAKKLAESLGDPNVEQLYCPAFKMKPCQCLQNYIIGNAMDEGHKQRALYLLSFLNEAKVLRKQKNVSESQKATKTEECNLGTSNTSTRGSKFRRSRAFEQFVLSKRRYLRDELGLCERACQRILMYSNNFLHKKVKSAPNNGPRIERTIGKNARGVLKPIADLARCSCCANSCVLLSLTHSKLLDSWRQMASLGQRQARRALAEMLTPSGGTKANCFKFIAMVTGCSYTTISLVNEHMKQTQGDREPPEHGLKRWWRTQAKTSDKATLRRDEEEEEVDNPEVYIPSQAELRTMGTEQAAAYLQAQRDKLVEMQKQLTEQRVDLEQQRILFKEVNATEVVAESHMSITSQQLLDILQLPSTCSGVQMQASEVISSPIISVMTSSGNFEPLGNIGNINHMGNMSDTLPGSDSQAVFSNVVILPDPEHSLPR